MIRQQGCRHCYVWTLPLLLLLALDCVGTRAYLLPNIPALSSVVALGANLICNKVPGLSPRQRTICRSRPDAIAAVGQGATLAVSECVYQFRKHRWNCTFPPGTDPIFGPVQLAGTKEAAFMYAIRSAGVAYAITQSCSTGNLTSCGCDKHSERTVTHDFQWGGCSADVKYGLKFSRVFIDAREVEEDSRSLMNLHNNRAGRKALKDGMDRECKCHGVSGSCTLRTCWRTLPSFRTIGSSLMKRYNKARHVVPIKGRRARVPIFLKLKRSRRPNKKPRRADLVFLRHSPNYCDYDPQLGSLGTRGRQCNRSSTETDGCNLLCCGRGYNTHQYTRTWKCHCKFHWCCRVTCQDCSERVEIYTCK